MAPDVDKRLDDAAREAGFEIDELIGSGASGTVFRAKVSGTEQRVALKLLRPLADPERFRRELDTLGKLRIERVPALVASGEIDGRPFLATEWVTGRPLAVALSDGALPPDRAVGVFGQLATILDAVHDAGVVHRDLSPANILLDGDGQVHLIDFGVSNQQDDVTLTADGVAPGTPRYLAPEVLAGANATPASDQYGAAVVLYEMLTGRFAYRASTDTLATTVHDHVHGRVVPPSEANPWLPSSLDAPLARALAKDPSDRFPSVAAFAAALRPASEAPSRRRKVSKLVVLVAVALTAMGAGWLLRDTTDDQRSALKQSSQTASVPYLVSVPGWRSGVAAGLGCNLATDAGFDGTELPVSFYDQDAARNALVADAGVGRSPALLIGNTPEYGLYGEVIDVAPSTAYVFSFFVDPVDEIDSAEVRISWLDADFTAVADDIVFELDPERSGRVTVETDASPDDAAYAVPTIEKREAPGSLVVDEIVFADASNSCASLVRAG